MSLCVALLSGCAAQGTSGGSDRPQRAATRAEVCKAGDERVDSEAACLLDDAACYQLATGAWCTGPRGNVCPAGSSAVPAGQSCPAGAVCFRMGESLECLAG